MAEGHRGHRVPHKCEALISTNLPGGEEDCGLPAAYELTVDGKSVDFWLCEWHLDEYENSENEGKENEHEETSTQCNTGSP